jgi:hypothetical protein
MRRCRFMRNWFRSKPRCFSLNLKYHLEAALGIRIAKGLFIRCGEAEKSGRKEKKASAGDGRNNLFKIEKLSIDEFVKSS